MELEFGIKKRTHIFNTYLILDIYIEGGVLLKKLAFAVTAASGAAAVISNHEADASTQHTVKSGESLWTISQQYGVSVDEIKQNNNLNNNIVFPGQVIEVGGSGSQEQGSSSNTSSQSSGGSTHTVKSGESLNTIASNYGVSVDEIMSANNLNGYIIYPNQTLSIPNGATGGSCGSCSSHRHLVLIRLRIQHHTNQPLILTPILTTSHLRQSLSLLRFFRWFCDFHTLLLLLPPSQLQG